MTTDLAAHTKAALKAVADELEAALASGDWLRGQHMVSAVLDGSDVQIIKTGERTKIDRAELLVGGQIRCTITGRRYELGELIHVLAV